MLITDISIRRPVVAWVMSLILIVFGIFVFLSLSPIKKPLSFPLSDSLFCEKNRRRPRVAQSFFLEVIFSLLRCCCCLSHFFKNENEIVPLSLFLPHSHSTTTPKGTPLPKACKFFARVES